MSVEAVECAAAFFRSKGKDVVTAKEFAMSVSLDLKWMSVKDAEALLALLVEAGAVEESNGYARPAGDYTAVQVPIAYSPPESLKKAAAERVAKGRRRGVADRLAAPGDMFPEMVEKAVAAGIPKGEFVSECNSVRRRLGVEMVAAALLVLRDAGVDIAGLADRAYAQIAAGRKRGSPLALVLPDEVGEGHALALLPSADRGAALHGLLQLDPEGLLEDCHELVVRGEVPRLHLVEGELLHADGLREVVHGEPLRLPGLTDGLPVARDQFNGRGSCVDVAGLHAPFAPLQPLVYDPPAGGLGGTVV